MDNDFATGYALGSDSNSGNNSGFWGGDGWWAIIIFAMIFGWGNGGWGGFGNGGGAGYQGALTRSDLSSEFAFNDLQRSVAGVQNGLCDGFYAMNTGMLTGFNGVSNAISTLGYNVQQGTNDTNVAMLQGFNGVQTGLNSLANQSQSCCCETQRQIERGFCDTNYNLATNTTNIIQSQHNDTDRVIAKLNDMENARQAEKIAALQAENQSLKFAANQNQQNAYLTATMDANKAELIRRLEIPAPVPAYSVPAPYPYGYNGNCGNGCC